MKMEKQTVSQWLSELDSHGIYDSPKLKEDFEKRTGQKAPDWPEYSARETESAIRGRGLGGSHVNTNGHKEAWGYTLASYFARTLANYHSPLMGRGFLFRDCIQAIKKAGF